MQLADRLASLRQQRFVGRDAERAFFASLLDASAAPVQVLHMYGPGGLGKSTLLREFERLCRERAVPVTLVDGRDLDPTPQGLAAALGQVTGDRTVLLVDTYERLAPVDSWLRETFLPNLPASTLVVLAGRYPPATAWRLDPGWAALLRALPLRNLSPEEARDYLGRRSVPEGEHRRMLEFTHGHPLALSLVADDFLQRPDASFQGEASPDILNRLLEHFMDHVPGPEHRAALEACGVVRVTNEALLGQLLTGTDGPHPGPLPQGRGERIRELFEWLRGLSFIEGGPEGLFPHDLAREALAGELRWRNPEWYGELHRRARTYYAARLASDNAERVLVDYIFLHRDNPVVRPFFIYLTGQQTTGLTTDILKNTDTAELIEMVRSHEGDESAQLAAHWLKRQPENVLVFRGPDGAPAAFCTVVGLEQTGPEDAAIDPALASAMAYLDSHAPLRPGETAILFRHWMDRDQYQGISPAQNLILVNMVKQYLTTARLAFSFFPCSAPEVWADIFAYADMQRMPEADFQVGGRAYGVYTHDWRAKSPAVWLALMADREMARPGPATALAPPSEPVLVLSQAEFASAVRDALKGLIRPASLASNPLVRSRLVIESGRPLQDLIREAAESLKATPRTEKFYQALYHTYLHPAPSQEAAAELLDLPFSTFRRHLTEGITRITESLWQRELGEPDR